MKKILFILFLLLNLLLLLPENINIHAVSINQPTKIIFSNKIILENGDYIIEEIVEITNSITTFSETYNKTGAKRVTKYDSNDNISWIYILNASFTITTDVSSQCTSATYSTTINDSNWKFSNGNAYYQNNIAYGTGVFKHKVLFITTQNYNIDLSLTCDLNGNLT